MPKSCENKTFSDGERCVEGSNCASSKYTARFQNSSVVPCDFGNMFKPAVANSAVPTERYLDDGMDFEESSKEECGSEINFSPSSYLYADLEATAAESDNNEVQNEDCSICLNEMTKGDVLWELDKCKHKFHWICVDEWLRNNSSCPLCHTRYGLPKGNQPPGTMNIRTVSSPNVPGFSNSNGHIEISYNIPGGIQGVS